MSDTDLTPRRRLRPAVAVAMVLFAVAAFGVGLASCSDDRDPETVEIVVPAGTSDRIQAGETVSIMPNRLELRVGDTLLIRNEDDALQVVGPYTVPAGEEMRLTYGVAGEFEGYCAISEGERYQIIVSD